MNFVADLSSRGAPGNPNPNCFSAHGCGTKIRLGWPVGLIRRSFARGNSSSRRNTENLLKFLNRSVKLSSTRSRITGFDFVGGAQRNDQGADGERSQSFDREMVLDSAVQLQFVHSRVFVPNLNRSIRSSRSDLVGAANTEEYPEHCIQAQTFFQDKQVTDH